MTTFAQELKDISQNALDKQAKKEEERARAREESLGKKMSFLMWKYHPVLKKGLFEAACSGKTQFRFVIEDNDAFAFDYFDPDHGFELSYIEPSQWTKELLNPDSKFLPFKKDGITRDSFTGLTVKHDSANFDDKEFIATGLGYLTTPGTIYDFSW